MEQQTKVEEIDGAASGLSDVLGRGFDDHWALVRHGNPALADDVFAESLARTAWDAATAAERKDAELRCAKTSVLLDGHHAYTALSVQTMMMDAVSMRSNAELRGASRLHGEASLSNDVLGNGGK